MNVILCHYNIFNILYIVLHTTSHQMILFPFSSLLFTCSSLASFCLRLCSLLHFPDGDLAIMARRATQDIAILSRAERLDAVWMGLQLLCHSVALWVHHQHLTSQLTVTLTSNTASAATAHPDLRGGEGIKGRERWKSGDWRGEKKKGKRGESATEMQQKKTVWVTHFTKKFMTS